jgi:subtilisin family serine protease
MAENLTSVFRIGESVIGFEILGSGLRYGQLPPRPTNARWDLDDADMRSLEAFEEAGWRFYPQPEIDWAEAKEINGGDFEAALLARQTGAGLVILANHLVTPLPPGHEVLDPEQGQATPLPVGTGLFDIRLRVPDRHLLKNIELMVRIFSQMHSFNGAAVAEPRLYYHLVNPGTAYKIKADPESQWQWPRIHLEAAWLKGGTFGKRSDGTPTRVAIIDLGFYIDDTQLQVDFRNTAFVDDAGKVGLPSKDANGKVSYVDLKGDVIASEMPQRSHGNICAGLVGARRGDFKVNGVAPDCELMLVGVQSVTTTVAVAKAINICVNGINGGAGADVISGSIGPEKGWSLPNDLATEIKNAGSGRGSLGTPIVWASFNTDDVIQTSSLQGEVICVSQSDTNDHRFSSGYGSALDLLAPGVDVTVDNPEVGGGVATARGSSCAAPMVAGIAALVLSVNPHLKASEVADILTLTCDPDVKPKKHDDKIGFGRVNALRAIKETPAPPP